MPQPAAPRPALVLASASPRRAELLSALGVPFAVWPADADETVPAGLAVAAVAGEIAARKAAVARAAAPPDAALLAADTIVALDGRVFGKPADAAQASAMLAALAGREHAVFTAVVLAWNGRYASVTVQTTVRLRDCSAAEIAASIAAGTPFDKAGGYAIQDPLLHPVERCDGCYCNVMGLPLWTVYGFLEALPETAPRPPNAAYARCATCPLRPQTG